MNSARETLSSSGQGFFFFPSKLPLLVPWDSFSPPVAYHRPGLFASYVPPSISVLRQRPSTSKRPCRRSPLPASIPLSRSAFFLKANSYPPCVSRIQRGPLFFLPGAGFLCFCFPHTLFFPSFFPDFFSFLPTLPTYFRFTFFLPFLSEKGSPFCVPLTILGTILIYSFSPFLDRMGFTHISLFFIQKRTPPRSLRFSLNQSSFLCGQFFFPLSRGSQILRVCLSS